MAVVGKVEGVLLDDIAVGSGDGVGGGASSAGHELHIVVRPVHVVHAASKLQLRSGIALPGAVPRGVGLVATVEIAVGLVDSVVDSAGPRP